MEQQVTEAAGLVYIFLIFFITLGPVKVVTPFVKLTQTATPESRRGLAVRGALIASAIVVVVAVICSRLRENWGISFGALSMAAGLLLLISALDTIRGLFAPQPHDAASPPPAELKPAPRSWGLSPVALPMLVTPYGIAAILLFLARRPGDWSFLGAVIGMLLLVMVLNLLAMLFARPILKTVTPAGFFLIASLLSILQAALAIEAIIAPLRRGLGLA